MFEFKKIVWFSILVTFFSLVLIFWEAFLGWIWDKNEEDFLDISVYEIKEKEKIKLIDLAQNILKEKKQEETKLKKQKILEQIQKLKQADKKKFDEDIKREKEKQERLTSALDISYNYIPENFISNIIINKENFSWILSWRNFRSLIKKITLTFYEKRWDVRWKMKNKTIKLFAPQQMEEDELLAIFIHELSHYIDLYFLERIDWEDVSNEFYDISWYSTIVMNPWLQGKDFVSGYAMTNKYEDFAESLAYYVFHNDDFVVKTQDSDILNSKYRFIQNAIFRDNSFVWTDFSSQNTIKNYYRDITKIHFSQKNFLQYVKNSI